MRNHPLILVTGTLGLAGSHLAKYLLENEWGSVLGVFRKQRKSNEILGPLEQKVEWVECDLTREKDVAELIHGTKPDLIFHLAAQSHIPSSWEDPAHTMHNNVLPAFHLFKAIQENRFSTRILVAGSSEEYGWVHAGELPVNEENPLRPLNPYAISKVALDLLGWQYFKNFGLPVVRTRSFNNLGAARHKPDATNDWIRQIVRMEQGKCEPVLQVGNLETKRDFVDIRDVVRAYWLALTQGEPGEVYNIASQRMVSMQELMEALLRLTPVKVRVIQDPHRLRPSDVPFYYGDYSKLKKRTGWTPAIGLEKTLQDMFLFWRSKEC